MPWAPDYITPAELKAYLRINPDDDVDDDEIADACTVASRAVDGTCGRQFGQVDAIESRIYVAQYSVAEAAWFAVIDDLQTLTGLAVTDEDDDVIAADDYRLLPLNNAAKGWPYERIRLPAAGEYTIEGRWGWAEVPTAVKLACKLQGSRFMARRDSPYGVAGSPEDGSEVRLLARVDPDVEVSLRRGKYVRAWWAA